MNSGWLLLDHASVLPALWNLRRIDRRPLSLLDLGTWDFHFIPGGCHSFVLLIKVFEKLLHDVRLFLLTFIYDSWITEGLLDSSFSNVLNVRVDTTISIHHAYAFVAVRNLQRTPSKSLVRLGVWVFGNRLDRFRVIVYRFQYLLQLNRFLGRWLRVECSVHHLIISHISTDTCGRLPIIDDILDHQILVWTSLSWTLGIVFLFRIWDIVLPWFFLDFGILLTPFIVSLLLFLLKNRFLERTGDQSPTLPLVITLHWIETHV